jgi:hypothetical protein
MVDEENELNETRRFLKWLVSTDSIPFIRGRRSMWVRLLALWLLAFLPMVLVVAIVTNGFGLLERNGDVTLVTPATAKERAPEVRAYPRVGVVTPPAPSETVNGGRDPHVDPLEHVGIDPATPKDPHVDPLDSVRFEPARDQHVDPLEDVGIDPTTPKDPHVDPLEDVGIDPTPPEGPKGDPDCADVTATPIIGMVPCR